MKNKLLIYAVTSLFFIPLTVFFEIKLAIIFTSLLVLFEIILINKKKILPRLLIAFFMALFITTLYAYEYTTINYLIWKINLFPLICWTTGLLLFGEVYEKLRGKYRFVSMSLIYLLLLIVFEYIGYHFLGIRLNSNYNSLFNLGVIHAPLGMKIFYLTAGPVYLLLIEFLRNKPRYLIDCLNKSFNR